MTSEQKEQPIEEKSLHSLIDDLMSNVNQIIDYMISHIKLEDDKYLTVKDRNKAVLVATTKEFIIVDRDKFKQLEISKNNRFLV